VSQKALARCRRAEKGGVEARDRCILKFPLSVSPNAVAKALIGEGWYSKKTKVYYIEFRVRRLRTKAEREKASADVSIPPMKSNWQKPVIASSGYPELGMFDDPPAGALAASFES
jgi:hypothetical protein